MVHNSSFSGCGATALILIILAVIGGLVLASPPHGHAAFIPQQADELSWSAQHGDGGEATPASESSYSDYNPSCNQKQIIPVYRPTVSPLVCFEPFTALPKVYPERFVPPQNL